WAVICTPTSTWRGGSVEVLLYQWLPSMMGFLNCGLIVTLSQGRSIGAVLSGSSVFMALSSFFLFKTVDDRNSLAEGTLSNPNDLASLLLLGAPFLLVPLLVRKRSRGAMVAAA